MAIVSLLLFPASCNVTTWKALIGIIPAAGIDLAVYNTLRDNYTKWMRERMVAEVQAETKKRNSLNPSLATQLEQKGDSAAAAILEKYGGASSASMHPLRRLF